ncbi:M15 family metallopeptidase [Amycolatopsis kentuckyensis]|uniref:M15 family metallopeptidase n=1 Tax=Amycolatopsis kentuckyensis TaxID=218823 RepID=UPI003563F415
MTTSQNGFSAPISPARYNLPGGAVSLRSGPTGALLAWVGQQFHALVEPLVWPGCWGYAYRDIRGATQLSNHASGTALDLNAPKHPLDTNPSANFTAAQIAAIRNIVARTEGCVRWGGDYTGRKDPMHFEINASEARCAAVLAKLTAGGGGSATTGEKDMQLTDPMKLQDGAVIPVGNTLAGTFDAVRGKSIESKEFPGHFDNLAGFVSAIDQNVLRQGREITALKQSNADLSAKLDRVLTLLASKASGQ